MTPRETTRPRNDVFLQVFRPSLSDGGSCGLTKALILGVHFHFEFVFIFGIRPDKQFSTAQMEAVAQKQNGLAGLA
jgi:hypothetical protein